MSKTKIESFKIIANIDTNKERVITTFQIKNDDMDYVSELAKEDIAELLHVLADGGTVSAESINISIEEDESEDGTYEDERESYINPKMLI